MRESVEKKRNSSPKKSDRKPKQPVEKSVTTIGICGIIGGIALACAGIFTPREALPDLVFPKIPSETPGGNNIYSRLTGLPLASEAEVTAPAFCVQTPNGTDGARPHAGLDTAGVVFEAIAERGITRFAAIYQNSASAVIGPIRSLRLYYLEWDTPFDCTIVHAGGADDALAAVRAGGYRDLTENYQYMYRGTTGTRLWNNLFTTSSLLKQMNEDRGYGGSDIKGFARMTPEESLKARINAGAGGRLDITAPTTKNTSLVTPTVTSVAVDFGSFADFNVRYNYNAETNVYLRSYESGGPHEVYVCPNEDRGETDPESTCELGQIQPSVVVAMMVDEHVAEDGYHEDIAAVGTGEAYVFQNGQVVHGTWTKSTVADQIKFFDEKGAEIRLAPGQTFVEAVPKYGAIDFN